MSHVVMAGSTPSVDHCYSTLLQVLILLFSLHNSNYENM